MYHFYDEKTKSTFENAKYEITYDYVNVRAEPFDGEILYQLYKGDIVTLTGHYDELVGATKQFHIFVEIQDGGWITHDALALAEK